MLAKVKSYQVNRKTWEKSVHPLIIFLMLCNKKKELSFMELFPNVHFENDGIRGWALPNRGHGCQIIPREQCLTPAGVLPPGGIFEGQYEQ